MGENDRVLTSKNYENQSPRRKTVKLNDDPGEKIRTDGNEHWLQKKKKQKKNEE